MPDAHPHASLSIYLGLGPAPAPGLGPLVAGFAGIINITYQIEDFSIMTKAGIL